MSFAQNIILIAMVIAKSKAGDPPAPNLFANLDPKEAPLYICKETGNPIQWKLPSSVDCSPVDTTLPTSIVNITLWFEDSSPPSTIPIYECYSEVTFTRTTFHWNFEIVETSWNETSDMSLETCVKILENLKGNDLHILENNLYGTTKFPKRPKKYMASTSSSAENYYIVVSKATVNNKNWTLETNLSLTETCFFDWKSCRSQRGIVAWDNDSNKICTLKKGISTTCIVTGPRMSCNEDGLSFTLNNFVNRCGMIIGSTEEGILFTRDNMYAENGLNLGTTPTSLVAQDVFGDENRISSTYNFNKFKFLYKIVNENSSDDIQFVHEWACDSNRKWYDFTRVLVGFGASTNYQFKLLGGSKDDKHLATLDGRVLSIFKCSIIYEYQMLPRGSECIREWPIAYIHENVKKTGYVRGLSHEIVDFPTKTECDSLEFYFNSGKHFYLLNDNSVIGDNFKKIYKF